MIQTIDNRTGSFIVVIPVKDDTEQIEVIGSSII
jgi:hypothetical protein